MMPLEESRCSGEIRSGKRCLQVLGFVSILLCFVGDPVVAQHRLGSKLLAWLSWNTFEVGENGYFQAPSTDDARLLEQAIGAFRAALPNFAQARALAEKLRDKPGSIGESAKDLIKTMDIINDNNRKAQQARIEITRKNADQACTLLSEIESRIKLAPPRFARDLEGKWNIAGLKAQAGGCRPQAPEPVDELKPEYDKALALIDKKKFRDARTVLRRIRAANPQYKDVEAHIGQVEQAIKEDEQLSSDQKFTELVNLAEKLHKQGDPRGAYEKLDEARPLNKNNKDLGRLSNEIEKAIRTEADALFEGINFFYEGKYEKARDSLIVFVAAQHSPTVLAMAHFYLGAAIASEFLLTGAKSGESEARVKQQFMLAKEKDPNFLPPLDKISPKIRELYPEAARRQKE